MSVNRQLEDREHVSGEPERALVSVVIPCYNHGHFLGEAIRSVLEQDYPAIEVIVVNDGSTDNTAEVVATFPSVRYLALENQGLAAARNAGLSHCTGELVVFLDADDRLLPGAIATGARILTANPALGFTAGYSRFISGDGALQPTNQPVRTGDDAYVALLRRNTIRNPAMVMFRRRIVTAVGGFPAGADACADYSLYLRISREYPVLFHNEVVAEYRKHGDNMSGDSALMLRQLLLVMHRQRPHLVNSARRDAYREGVRNIRSYYGDLVATRIRGRIRARVGWGQTLRDVAVLAWHHPMGTLEHMGRKLTTAWRGDAASRET